MHQHDRGHAGTCVLRHRQGAGQGAFAAADGEVGFDVGGIGVHRWRGGGRLRGGRVVQAGDLAVAVDGDGGVDVGMFAVDADDHHPHAGLRGDHRFVAAGLRPGGGELRLHRCELVDAQGILHLRGEVGRGGFVFAGLHVVEQAGGNRHGVGVAFGGHRRQGRRQAQQQHQQQRLHVSHVSSPS